jgi:hypothetical protein
VNSNNEIGAISRSSLEDIDEEEEFKQLCEMGKKFYECVENFVIITV